ncbi:MAG: glycoside hydrolase family 28 protein [Bacteroidetes bacterium]|nr:glycoside hydrolase family 28 protein [Bacteroidota bacterium]
MNYKKYILPLFCAIVLNTNAQPFKITQPTFKKDTFNIVKYGAVADGITLNSKAIQSAIDACSKKGGGVVLVPGGFWATGPIEIKSNVNLHIKRDAVLQFTDDLNEYKIVEMNWEGLDGFRNQSPISATNAVNVAITGSGIVDGNGDAWRMVKKDKLTSSQWKNKVASGGVLSEDGKTWYPSVSSLAGVKVKKPGVKAAGETLDSVRKYKDFLRPNLLVFAKCKNVLLDGVTFQNSPAWNIHPLMCENLTVRNVYAKNPWYAQNGDGIDIESCKNFLIENSTFDVGDDGICIKSGRDAEGRKRNMPTENGIIKNCIVYHAHGGFVIGSEMSGGARNLFVSNCTFIGTDIGLRFKTTRGRGGAVEKIYIDGIRMKDIAGEAILFDMYYAAKDPVPIAGEKRELPKVEFKPIDETTPIFKDFYVKNVVCNGAEKAIFIRGIPEMHIKNINLENMTLQAKIGVDIQEATGINIKNVNIISKENNPLLYVLNSDAIVFDKVQYKAADVLVQVEGDRSGNVKVLNTDASKAKKKMEIGFGAKEETIKIQ